MFDNLYLPLFLMDRKEKLDMVVQQIIENGTYSIIEDFSPAELDYIREEVNKRCQMHKRIR